MTTSSHPDASVDASVESTRLRYYILDSDGSEARFEFLNEDTALIDRRWSGSHVIRPRGLDFVTTVGLPPIRETPSLKVGSRKRGKAPFDLYSRSFFSDKFKRLLEEFVPADAWELIECDAVNLNGTDAGSYWWIEIIRILDAVDEERSVLTRQIDNPFSSGTEIERIFYLHLQDIWFRPEVVGDAHVFRLSLATEFIIVDGMVADRIRALELTNVLLTPLQPPTPDEYADHWRFKNYPYWTKKKSAE